ncbi:MAG TPA: adenylate/guanylate cyclase domain-containing protein [Burkholderiaceae bacterium]
MVRCPRCGEENPPKFRLCGYCGSPLAAAALPAHELRKTVTIVFCDLKSSTALGERLDPEALHDVKERYFRAMAAEITRHGGLIEKYIGDAIMAVFGLPRAHEDDALRAVRAAVGMQKALNAVNADLLARYDITLANRTGINTGEVVANDDPTADQKLATGDAVNVAARLEQAAPADQILIGEVTYRLVRDAVRVEAVEPLELKGKAQRVPAYRLLSADGLDGQLRRIDTPLVGREEELATLARAYREASEGLAVRLVTVIGEAGAGKSRLLQELAERVAVGARVLRGRCLAYGDGITFWPLRGIVGSAAGIRDDDSPADAQAKVLAVCGDANVADRLASAIGLSPASFPLHEVNWAARRLLEILASDRPVVAVIDDIHWAESALLDLIDSIVTSSTGAPILLLATTRPDLFEEHPQWGESASATRLMLRPLSDRASAQVATNLLGDANLPEDVVERIVDASEGNPLFVEQMLSMLIDSGALRQEDGRWRRAHADAEIVVPPTIHALLEARLDQLGRAERAAVEPAAVIGLEFAEPAVVSLAPEVLRPAIGEHLGSLTRKQFIRVSRAIEAEPVYRFQHQLVRDTIYTGLLKRARASLHIEFVRWADRMNADRDRALEFEAILGYHLEQAHKYLRELGPLDESGIAIGRDGARRLANAGRRAFASGDIKAAGNLLQRAVALLQPDDAQRMALLPELGETLMSMGDFAAARAALDEAMTAADRTGDPRVKASSQLVGMFVRLYSGEQQSDWSGETLRVTHEIIPILERESAHNELATGWRLIVLVHGMAGRYTLATEAVERSIFHARQAGNERLLARNGLILSMNGLFGPTPVREAVEDCERFLAEGLSDRQVEGCMLCMLAQLKAMDAKLEEARTLYRRGRRLLRELGQGVSAASTGIDLARVELLGGDLALAEREVRSDYDFLARMGETYFLSTMAALLSRIVRDQGRDEEAMALSQAAEAATAADDVESQALWRAIRAPIVARAGNAALGEELARGALDLARKTEAPMLQADALSELAAVLRLRGRASEAHQAMNEAIELYVAKGNIVSATRAGLTTPDTRRS